MSRLSIETPGRAQNVLDGLHRDMERRIGASAYGLCPVDMSLNYLRLCHAQTCGKCVPCRIGLGQLEVLIEQVLDRTATMETINIIERTAKVIADSAGCAIGYEAAYMVLKGIRGFREDYFPSPAILKEWLTMGDNVTITADAHEAKALTFGFEEAAAQLKELGYTRVLVLGKDGFAPCEL